MNFQLGTAIGAFNSTYMFMTSTLTLLHRQADLGVAILCPLGEFCVFALFRRVLTISVSFATVPVMFPTLWLSLCPLDGFVVSLKLFDSCECCFAAPLGEFCVFGLFGCILMFPASFAGVIVCVRMFSVPGWFLDPSVSFAQPFVPMVSGFGSFDSIGRILMVSASSLAVSMS